MAPSATVNGSEPFGHRLLPVLIDEIAQQEPDRLFCIIPGFPDGPHTVTMNDFARAINRTCFWLEAHVGQGGDFETLAYMGPNDIRYCILLLAAIKVGYKLLLPSLRNSVQNHLHVFGATECNTLLKASTISADHILAQRDLRCITVPELEELLSIEPVKQYPYTKTFEEARMEPTLVLHSSGSTGPPKPITWTNGSLASLDAHHLLPSEPGCLHFIAAVPAGTKLLISMPLFHVAGLFSTLLMNVYWNLPSVHLPPHAVHTADEVLNVLDDIEADIGVFPPSILEDMSRSPQALAKLAKLSTVWYGGGPIADYAGEVICKKTDLLSIIGSTESSIYPLYLHDSRDEFAWFRFRTDVRGIEFQEREDDLYELVMTRDSNVDYQATFYNFPDLEKYPTKDLYRKHPSKAGYWKHVARSDDVIVLSNGEKVVGIPMENTLRQAPQIHDVLILGHGQFQVAALIELREVAENVSSKDIIRQISPYIKHANEMVPGFARLSKDRILFTTAGKPMIRTPKGTVVRKVTLAAYEREIHNLYNRSSKDDSLAGPILNCDDVSSTEKTLLQIFSRATDFQEISTKQDVFVAGLDSLQVLTVIRQIKAIIEHEEPEHAQSVGTSLVYSHPTIEKLALALRTMTDPQTASQETSHARKMEETLVKYSKDLPKAAYTIDFNNITVILTGTTGGLGSYLLDVLLSNPRVSRIYALNRAADGKSRQSQISSSRGLSVGWEEKVVFLQTALGEDKFGLDQKTYTLLSRETCVIIHNQWQVDFNLSLESFEPHICGVRNLIDFSALSIHHPPIFFTSSVSTAGNWQNIYPGEPIPEQVIGDMRVPSPIGYGESKYISENLLVAAGKKGVSAAICRVGQLAGPVEKGGMWNKQEWLPSLIASSKYLKCLPATIGGGETIDWIPVDAMATIIVELVAHGLHVPTEKDAAWTNCYNLVNPSPTTWTSLIPAIQGHLPENTKVILYAEWLDALRKSAAEDDVDPVKNPGIKLLEFYEGLVSGGMVGGFITTKAEKTSEKMRGMKGVSADWMELWMKQWAF